jgi:hypothetical protein
MALTLQGSMDVLSELTRLPSVAPAAAAAVVDLAADVVVEVHHRRTSAQITITNIFPGYGGGRGGGGYGGKYSRFP